MNIEDLWTRVADPASYPPVMWVAFGEHRDLEKRDGFYSVGIVYQQIDGSWTLSIRDQDQVEKKMHSSKLIAINRELIDEVMQEATLIMERNGWLKCARCQTHFVSLMSAPTEGKQ